MNGEDDLRARNGRKKCTSMLKLMPDPIPELQPGFFKRWLAIFHSEREDIGKLRGGRTGVEGVDGGDKSIIC